ncbi:hypothetical protein F5146DRAFT_923206, partial [Armillaria mellea]
LDHVVATHMSRYSYGSQVYRRYNPHKADHYACRDTTFFDEAGVLSIPGQFSIILPKDTQVSETTELCQSFLRKLMHLADLQYIREHVKCYHGIKLDPCWIDEEPDAYSYFCAIEGDTSEVARSLRLQWRPDRKSYFTLSFSVVLLFGKTELKTQLSWKENVSQKYQWLFPGDLYLS